MTRDQREPQELWLEGLVLRDAQGILYEVPCTLIERYQVTEERAAELVERLAATDYHAASPTREGDGWMVRGAVFALAPSRGGLLQLGHSRGADPNVRTFQSPTAFGSALA